MVDYITVLTEFSPEVLEKRAKKASAWVIKHFAAKWTEGVEGNFVSVNDYSLPQCMDNRQSLVKKYPHSCTLFMIALYSV